MLRNLHQSVRALENAGARVTPVSLPWTVDIAQAWGQLWEVMLAASFGDCLHDHEDRMDPEVVTLIKSGLKRDAVSYKRIEDTRTRQWHQLAQIFNSHDALLCPTMAQVAPGNDRLDTDYEHIDDQGRLHGLDMTGVFNNVPHCPALSVPSGFDAQGLPTAAQIVTRRFDDPMALRIGAALQSQL